MARSVETIFNQILAEKAKYSSLNSLNSNSATAIWRNIYYVMAITIATAEQLRDLFQTNLINAAKSLPQGVTYWYAETLKKYQDGYVLSYNKYTGRIEYSTIDTTAQILKVATCEVEGSNIVLKTIKDDGQGGVTNLNDIEKQSVTNYINAFKFAGPIVKLVSDPADLLKLTMNVQINPSLLNINGELITDPSIKPIEDAIDSLLITYQDENFDSTIKMMKVVDAVQNVNGVLNAVIVSAEAKNYNEVYYTNVMLNNLQTYKSNSGWLVIEELIVNYII